MNKFLSALKGENRGSPPIWLMRQAGRYLPEYRALRENHSLFDLFFTPKLAKKVTLMPIERFGFDAAIYFSDITIITPALGLNLTFSEGPKVHPILTKETKLTFQPQKLKPILEGIYEVKEALSIPLIGFIGAPFTVLSYLVGGLDVALHWLHTDRKSFQDTLQRITDVLEWFLERQIEAKVDAIQIFDSWANSLSRDDFLEIEKPHLQRLCFQRKVPLLFFMRNLGSYIEDLEDTPVALSLDETTTLQNARGRTKKTLQGNLDPEALFLPPEELREKVVENVEPMWQDSSFIFNLGHGVKPNTPIEAIEIIINTIRGT